MIREIYIENIALIDSLRVTFGPGFNVLTGETGAGKSIIVDAVNLILGGRSERTLVKQGQEQAYVEALVMVSDTKKMSEQLGEYGIVWDETELILSRTLTASGRSTCRINNRTVNLQALREVSNILIDLYGQNQSQKLLNDDYYLELIDAHRWEAIRPIKHKYQTTYEQYTEAKRELDGLLKSTAEKNRMLDLLEYQIGEIEAAALKNGEEEDLHTERTLLQNAERIAGNLASAKEAVQGERGALNALYGAMQDVGALAPMDARLDKLSKGLEEVYYTLEELGYEIADAAGGMVYDDVRLNAVEDRLATIESLKRKYGSTVSEVLAFLEDCRGQFEILAGSEARLEALEVQVQELSAQLEMDGALLTSARSTSADAFSQRLVEELSDLGMEDARVNIALRPVRYAANGQDVAEINLSVNKGIEPRPLARVASGGELSRIMLAIKNIAAEQDDVGTMIFDEIDTGISGRMAQVVAHKIANISHARQVICVTHLPQIAAMGDVNFYIEKHDAQDMTMTTVSRIEGVALEQEIARLSGGILTDTGLAYARELLDNAAKTKGI